MPTRFGSIFQSAAFARTSHRARYIFENRRIMITARAQPVFQHETGHAVLVQPERVIVSFVRREMNVTAARTNHQRRTRGICEVGQIWREGRDVIGGFAQGPGRAVRPERNGASTSACDKIKDENKIADAITVLRV